MLILLFPIFASPHVAVPEDQYPENIKTVSNDGAHSWIFFNSYFDETLVLCVPREKITLLGFRLTGLSSYEFHRGVDRHSEVA